MDTALAYKERFVRGEMKATEIVEKQLSFIKEHDPKIGAFLSLLEERALKKAQLLDAKRRENKPLGKLAGIPIAIKDNMHIRGEITTCGSRFLTNYQAPFDATVVRLMEEEDALLIGKTNLDEFAMGSSTENSAFHPTKNPWNLMCSPGGSSGGSAAAVAARFCPLALGSDTGGSIRQPAAFCGLVGFKPTYGRVSRFGLVAFGSSLDQIGPLAANVKDAALLLEVMGQHCDKDSTSLPLPPANYLAELQGSLQGKKIGVPWSFLSSLRDPVASNFKEALGLLKELGLSLIDVDIPILKNSIAVYYILSTAEASTNLARFDGIRYGLRSQKAQTLSEIYDLSRDEGFGDEVKNRILLGTFVLSSGYKEAFYKKGQQARTLFIEEFRSAFTLCDLIALPTAPSAAFELGTFHTPLEMYLQDIFTTPANLAGLPAVSLLSGFSSDKKPLGLQLLGPQLHDAEVLRVASAFEEALGLCSASPSLEAKP
ncbi:MAG TPA: Asp-tRNA(Asn)/Glu-tRNA(Gln) amidotransferase GatCAB subunit A [Parachlamydiales bacterium]|nr:MAG: glutaminyl-tRNA synthase (glutamine-hydrolyzing) subunit A [Chlamydiae bacterium GWA2_50_15]OGN57198.1 MAG: glutaminyl-tRNA synthase (glutamine-hydrolyzing) subunit A [Chlamydiae bacterium RIFCSPHIGHO2_02_FULL_49_29]OGN63290.1 MAG: glutaminyl-tRNA synthase (glutamine-hydrolyzing) subunit A [Chlamydiae bacterium RIFCSPHIGHO2_12_FULL_49_32]OGN70980.1 MAG: glutaminyl-tRNA synthase (glutamine-hydrolyzing) subunit A [Chlamydiae bacterium RIFCSPLOWO2_02_FULL_49_12]OGN71848.1 MAG: glutaminyl-t